MFLCMQIAHHQEEGIGWNEISRVLVFMYIQCIGAFYPGMLRIKIVRVYALYLKLFKQNCTTNMLYVNLSF